MSIHPETRRLLPFIAFNIFAGSVCLLVSMPGWAAIWFGWTALQAWSAP